MIVLSHLRHHKRNFSSIVTGTTAFSVFLGLAFSATQERSRKSHYTARSDARLSLKQGFSQSTPLASIPKQLRGHSIGKSGSLQGSHAPIFYGSGDGAGVAALYETCVQVPPLRQSPQPGTRVLCSHVIACSTCTSEAYRILRNWMP